MQYLVLVGAVVSLSFGSFYIYSTLKGRVQPNKVTWLLWAIAPLIATLAAISNGVTWSVIPVFMSGFMPLLIFIASFLNKDAYWDISRFDLIVGAVSILALVIWQLTKNPVLAIWFSILADGLAAVPTAYKAWKFPETETPIFFMGGIFSASTTFFAVTDWNFISIAFPIYLISLDITMILIINRKRLMTLLGA